MKKFILLIFLTSILFACKAQHTLSFNQGLLVSTSQTVPAGKIWKVVSCLPSQNSQINQNNVEGLPEVGTFAILVNGNTVYLSNVGAAYFGDNFYTEFTNVNANLFPMWIPAGTTLAASTGIQYLSVLEFIIN
jgi:hypothetical protein